MNIRHCDGTRRLTLLAGALLAAAWGAPVARAQGGSVASPYLNADSGPDPHAAANGEDPGTRMQAKARFDQKLNAQLPLDAPFRDDEGRPVTLRRYFGKKPVVLVMVYFNCTSLCSEVLHSAVGSLKDVKETVGQDFDVVAVSINPRETAKDAAGEKAEQVEDYGRNSEAGFHFLTGPESSIKPLANSAGFHYAWDESTKQYAHPNGIMIATPQGRLTRYLFGIVYLPRDVRFGLMEAAQGKIGSPVENILLTCYHYDPTSKSYSLSIMRVLRLVAIGTVMLMALGIGGAMLREKSRGAKSRRTAAPPSTL